MLVLRSHTCTIVVGFFPIPGVFQCSTPRSWLEITGSRLCEQLNVGRNRARIESEQEDGEKVKKKIVWKTQSTLFIILTLFSLQLFLCLNVDLPRGWLTDHHYYKQDWPTDYTLVYCLHLATELIAGRQAIPELEQTVNMLDHKRSLTPHTQLTSDSQGEGAAGCSLSELAPVISTVLC